MAPVTARLTLRDWTTDPPLVAAERAAPCPRLLSAAPNITEICAALGLVPCLIGRTRYCTWPPAVMVVPSIGALNDLNAEVLLELRPELILIAGRSRAIADRLGRLNLHYESVPDDRLVDLFTSLTAVGRLTGRPETAAAVSAGIRADLDAVARQYAGLRPARVLITLAPLADPPAPVHVAGPGSFYDDLLQRVGCSNAAAGSTAMFAPVALEFILQANPDVIIELVPERGARASDAAARSVWAKIGPLRAVTDQRVRVLVGPEHFLLGPRVAETLAALCAALAGEPLP
jgi:iron complex transport system substrate-binding protein